MAEENTGGEFGNNHELKPVAEPALVKAIKAGEALLSHAHLSEIKLRRAVADLDTLIAAYESLLAMLPDNFNWGPKAEAEPEAPAEEPAAEGEEPADAEGEES